MRVERDLLPRGRLAGRGHLARRAQKSPFWVAALRARPAPSRTQSEALRLQLGGSSPGLSKAAIRCLAECWPHRGKKMFA